MKASTLTICVMLWALLSAPIVEPTLAAGHRHGMTLKGGTEMTKGSGQLTTEQREVAPFTRIESNVSADIEVVIGKPQRVDLTFDDNLLEFISTKVEGKTLVIESEHSFSSLEGCQLKIVVPQLDAAVIGGSGNITVEGLDANRFAVEINGSGGVSASGKASELSIEVNGSGNVEAQELTASEASVEINGSGNVGVMARDYLTATINGSGDITYTGNPGQVSKSVAGSGRIRKR